MKKSDPPHKLNVQLNLSTASGERELNLSNFTCTCKAGKGMCNHKSALLFLTAHYKALGLKVSHLSRTNQPLFSFSLLGKNP